jgi:2-aminoadipate transaminase
VEENMTNSGNLITDVENIQWEKRLAERTAGMKSSIIRELLKLTIQPNLISFAGGLPAPELFPIDEFDEACHQVLQTQGAQALQYSPTEGYRPLKSYLAETMTKYGIEVEPENILMVNGSQQGLDLIGKLFVDPDSCIVCSRPTYLGALQAWNAYQGHYCTVDLDDDGMVVDQIPAILEGGHKPVFVYVLPNFHNPAGTTLSAERRERLVEMARKYDLVLIEDDPYGELRFEGDDLTPLFRMAPERTIYLSTFSKTLAPGIRLAWVVAPKPMIAKFVQVKQGADLHTGTFVQMVANELCQSGFIKSHVKTIRKVYRSRRDTMIDSLTEHMPEGVSWTHPLGGLFLWARTPEAINTGDLLKKAAESKVAYVPGFAFYPGEEGGHNAMRLNFSNATEEMINEGVHRLAHVIKEQLAGN